MFNVYILYDELRDKFYIGQTGNLEDHIIRHVNKRSKYTSNGNWKLVYKEDYPTRHDAIMRERYIKKLKDKSLIRGLVRASRS